MANASLAMTHTTAVVAAPGTSVAPAVAVPDNCHTILIWNNNAANDAFVTNGTPGAALTGANSKRVPALNEVALPMGVRDQRGPMDQATVAGSGLIIDAAAAMTVEITYLNTIGRG